jgi:hypothetical protein
MLRIPRILAVGRGFARRPLSSRLRAPRLLRRRGLAAPPRPPVFEPCAPRPAPFRGRLPPVPYGTAAPRVVRLRRVWLRRGLVGAATH